jgi:hypothetical protein
MWRSVRWSVLYDLRQWVIRAAAARIVPSHLCLGCCMRHWLWFPQLHVAAMYAGRHLPG